MTMTNRTTPLPDSIAALFEHVAQILADADVFQDIEHSAHRLVLAAVGTAAPAEYFLAFEDNSLWAGLATKDRWLSQSIEADLMNTGDSLVELLEEELVEFNCSVPVPSVDHFRDAHMRYTFQTSIPQTITPQDASLVLRAYEAAFRELGDMTEPDDQ
jgi:hypothetical protein